MISIVHVESKKKKDMKLIDTQNKLIIGRGEESGEVGWKRRRVLRSANFQL